MIEVEKKFSLTKEQEENLKKDAEFISQKEIIDIYFDNAAFDLTKNDIWLRERNNQFELKVSQNRSLERKSDQYKEIEDENEIREFLKLKKENSFIIDLKNASYLPFSTLKTTRAKFKKDEFTIDIDEVNGDNFFYGLVEIELMVENDLEIDLASEKIIDFAKSKGLETDQKMRGKLVEYIKQRRPDHFKVLVESGVAR